MVATNESSSVRSPLRSGLILSLALVILAGLGTVDRALADPLSTCRARGPDAAGVRACLERNLEASYGAMEEALARVRAVATSADVRTGGEHAVLAVEGSQQAWEAYRDTACATRGLLLDGDDEIVELTCAIELSQIRTAELLNLLGEG